MFALSKLQAELDASQRSLRVSEAQNGQLWSAVYALREELLRERASRREAVSRLWDDIGFLHSQLTSSAGVSLQDPEEFM